MLQLDPDRSTTLSTLLRRWAWPVALLPLIAAVFAIVALGEAERTASPTDDLPRGLDSTLGVELREELPEADSSTAVAVWSTPDSADGEAGLEERRQELQRAAGSLGAVPASLEIAEDGTAAIAVIPIEAGSATEVESRVDELREQARDEAPSRLDVALTGPAAVQADLAEVFSGANIRLLAATALVVALLLVITYRSPVLWLIPLTVVAVADRLAAVAATHTLAALDLAWNESTVGILSVLVFGAGTDYALLLISRYRDELAHESSRYAAMATAVRRTAEAVLASSVTVVVAVLTLALSLIPTTRGLGVACAVGVVIAAAFALVVLPAALVLCGRWVFWPRVPRAHRAGSPARGSLWLRLGRRVSARPAAFAVGTTSLLAALALGVLAIDTGLATEDQFLDEPESISAAARIGESFPAGVASPTQVVSRASEDDVLGAVEDVDAVTQARVSNAGNGVVEVSVILDAAGGTEAGDAAIVALRDAVSDLDDTHVVGAEAEALDENEAAARDRMVIFPLVLGLVLVALLVLLRSVVAPVLLVLTVLATYVASLGASWWIFTRVFDFAALDAGAPLLSFLFLVALGVDYNIFLVTRASEELGVDGPRPAMLRALAATGGVITSAGVLLAAVFLVLGVLPLVVLAQLGVIVCLGVLLDTLVVRTVLVPSLAFLLGDRFWWPRSIRRNSPEEAAHTA